MIKLAIALSFFVVVTAYANYQTYIIHTYGDRELIAVAQRELDTGDGGSASMYKDQLILRATPKDYARISQLLRQVDVAPTSLVLSLALEDGGQSSTHGGHASVHINQGVQANINHQNTRINHQASKFYTARTLSGASVRIGTDVLLGLSGVHTSRKGRDVWVSFGTSWVVLPNGFDATPRLLPNGQIALELQYASSTHALATNHLGTTITLERGKWTKIGELNTQSVQISSTYRTEHNQNTPIWMMVN